MLGNYIAHAGRCESVLAGIGVGRRRDIPGTGLNSRMVKVKPPRDKKFTVGDRSLPLAFRDVGTMEFAGCLTTGREMQ